MPDSYIEPHPSQPLSAPLQHWRTAAVVIGSGVAGLSCALALAPLPVLLLTKTPGPFSGSSVWAQGGIAAAVGGTDSPESHAQDTLAAGAGLVDADRALLLAREGAEAVRDLIARGVPFDRAPDGSVALGREAAHAAHRIVHAGGDATGRTLIEQLLRMAERTPQIRIAAECFVLDLTMAAGRVTGALVLSRRHGLVQVHANHVVLATGGVGALWRETTNPVEATGDGLALAARAGAELADLEFVQFHPTALLPAERRDGARLPLLTEALRGAGALLLDRTGRRFMLDEHPLAELAPRDVVARAIARRARDGGVFLDLRPALEAKGEASFPQGLALCRQAGFEPLREPVPVAPAAHYHMGGVVTDADGRTAVPGLWACGEVAMTGVHGANRLASNSLLEGLVFGRRVARDIRAGRSTAPFTADLRAPALPAGLDGEAVASLREQLRAAMARHVGIERDGIGLAAAAGDLARALDRLTDLTRSAASTTLDAGLDYAALLAWGELRNMLLAARMIVGAARQRTESRGAHFRRDHPESRDEWRHRQTLTLADLDITSTAGERFAAASPLVGAR